MQRSRIVRRVAMVVSTLGLLVPVARAAEIARGVVFEDLDGNGRRDAGEPGLAGVAVSNQDDVVQTDADGSYSLPVTDDSILFVVKPAGFAPPRNENNLPQFYYLHKPKGSPRLHYDGVAPTGPLPAHIDFALRRVAEPEDFTIVAMADPQPETWQEVEYARDDVFSELVGCGAAFAVVLGDIAFDHLDIYGGYNEAAGKIGIPLYNVVGNHDMNYDAADDRDSDETFHRHFGPNYYSWNVGKVHFVVLDSVEWQGPSNRGGGNYRGFFGPRQLAWLARDIALVPADHLVVLNMHIPIRTVDKVDCADRAELFAVLEHRQRVLALSGHTHFHENVFYTAEDGWKGRGDFHSLNSGTVSGSWWSGPKDLRGIPLADCRDGAPNGYTLVHFRGAEYTADYRGAGFSPDYRMRIYPPGSLGVELADKRTLLVNVFDGSDRCKVEYAMDGEPFAPLEPWPRIDPIAAILLSGPTDSGKPWATPYLTKHIWGKKFDLPFPGGMHVVTIRVTDHYGRTYSQSRIF